MRRLSRIAVAALFLVSLPLIAGCGTGGAVKSGDVSHGKTLFIAKCSTCHTLAGAGTHGTVGPNLDDAFAADRAQGYAQSTIEQVVADQIRLPLIGGAMPANLDLIGTPRESKTWGENVWIELAGHAVEEPEDIRDLYAEAAARWVEEGRTRQYAFVPASDSGLVDAWFRLGFGQQHAHALQEVMPREVALPPGIEIREPRQEEIEELIEIDLALPAHQGRSPVFSDLGQPTREELREEWASTLAGDEEHVLVAYQDGKPGAVWSVSPLEVSSQHRGLGRPERAAFLGFASTLPEFRGAGLGLALTDASFAWAAENGYEVMVTDWRVTNLLSSRFWVKRGFRPTFLRVYRSIP